MEDGGEGRGEGWRKGFVGQYLSHLIEVLDHVVAL